MDFSNFEFRAHSLGNIMVENREKSNMDKFIEMCEKSRLAKIKYDELTVAYHGMPNKELKGAIAAEERMMKSMEKYLELENKRKDLALIKDIKELSAGVKTFLVDFYVSVA